VTERCTLIFVNVVSSHPGILERVRVGALAMITLQDCIDLCGLDPDQVAAISEHEHVPEIVASALANYLLHQPRGTEAIRTMIVDDIRQALDDGRIKHAAELFAALQHFLESHPEGRSGLAAD
jgi:hypothetical protein